MKKIFLFALLCAAAVTAPALPEEKVAASVPGAMFLPDEKITFKNTLDTDMAFEVVRFPEKVKCAEGVMKAKASLALNKLPRGYYALVKKGDSSFAVRFAVVEDPAKKPAAPESFFALDAALSSLVPAGKEKLAVEIARRSGTRFIRERGPRFSRVEKEKDVIDYVHPLYIAELFNKAGIKVLSMYHSAPQWSKTERPGNDMPDDLFALYNYSKRTAEKVKAYCPAFEFWNETDYKMPDSAWDFASALKAASLGYKAGFPAALVMNGGFAINAGEQKYHHIMMQNGIADYLDIISLHCYGGISQYKNIMAANHKFLDKYNANRLKIWYTETGCRAEGKGKAAFKNSKSQKEHTFDQEMIVSEFLVKQMTTAQFYGVDRNFFFSLYPCNEERGAKVWGLTRKDSLQVKAGLAAFSTLIHKLSYAKMLGVIVPTDPEITGFLYQQPDGKYTLVIWKKSQNDTRIHEENIPYKGNEAKPFVLPDGTEKVENIFGTDVAVKDNKIMLGRMPVYITCSKQTAYSGKHDVKKSAGAPKDIDKSIVYQVIFSPEIAVGQEDGPWKSKPSQTAVFKNPDARVKVAVYNFSKVEKKGRIAVSGCKYSGIPDEEFAIEPMSKKVFVARLFPTAKESLITVSGVFNGKKTSDLAFPYRAEKTSQVRNILQLPDGADAWNRSAAGTLDITENRSDWSLCFRTVFSRKTKDRWSYPACKVNNIPDKGKIAFEAAIDTDPGELKSTLVLLHHENGKYRDIKFKYTAPRGTFQRFELPYTALQKSGKIKRIAIGANTNGQTIRCRLRNITITEAP